MELSRFYYSRFTAQSSEGVSTHAEWSLSAKVDTASDVILSREEHSERDRCVVSAIAITSTICKRTLASLVIGAAQPSSVTILHWTVRVMVVECFNEAEVPLTVMV